MTDPWADRAAGGVPFFISWGETAHPGDSLPALCTFMGVRAENPQSGEVTRWLSALGLEDVPVLAGDTPLVIATIGTPKGVVELC